MSVDTTAAGQHLQWRSARVGGRRANYGVGGDGPPVVFLHGWALGHHAYKRALKRLAAHGRRVYAPALPGFGGSGALPARHTDLAGYAAWTADFLSSLGVDEEVTVIGHSFGGAVAAQFAHDHGSRTARVVMINAVGGPEWVRHDDRVWSMAQRPLWDWALHFPSDLFLRHGVANLVTAVLEDAVPNLMTNPVALLRASQVARSADLTDVMSELGRRGVPVSILWGGADTLVTRASFDALCSALGQPGFVVEGRHSWLLADPDAFDRVVSPLLAAG